MSAGKEPTSAVEERKQISEETAVPKAMGKKTPRRLLVALPISRRTRRTHWTGQVRALGKLCQVSDSREACVAPSLGTT
jgi:hypothetical protein